MRNQGRMKKSSLVLWVGLVMLLGLVACSSKGSISEGKIDYSITFPEFSAEDHTFLAMLLPKQQTYTFKNNHFHSQVKKMMVEINIVSNTETNYFYSDLLFNETQYFEGTIIQDDLDKFEIEFTDKKDTIAGFNVKQALAHSNQFGTIELWYTEDITMINPNWHTPYYDVPGVLLDYTVIQNGVTMHFKATKFHDQIIDESIFAPTKKGSQVDFEVFQNELSALFENFLKP